MSKHGTLHRYMLIIEKLDSAANSSFADIEKYLHAHTFEISKRTLQRDLENIRLEFGVEIKYDRLKNAYFIDKEASSDLDTLLRFFQMSVISDAFGQNSASEKDNLEYIAFDANGYFKGTELIKDLLFALKNKRYVSFKHYSFAKETTTPYTVKPQFIKEYQYRWYLVALTKKDEVRTFGIDRMLDFKIDKEVFKQRKFVTNNELFSNVVGLNYTDIKTEEVLIKASALQAKYLLSLPIHDSQKVVKDGKSSKTFSYQIKPNHEFYQRILMLGNDVEIVSPKSARQHLKQLLKETLKNYA